MSKQIDFLLIGGGIMSATLAALLQERMPEAEMIVIERLPKVAEESSEAWNNAGTGHAGNCELNYTPEDENGNVSIDKACKIADSFVQSLAFWKDCAERGWLSDYDKCVNRVPHLSFVEGEENVNFLRERWQKMKHNPHFEHMKFSTDWDELCEWIPLMMEGRDKDIPVAATKVDEAFDVNFGEITDQLFAYLSIQNNINLLLENEAIDFEKMENGNWLVEIKDLRSDHIWKAEAKFVFIGAGGGALPLFEKSDIEEAAGYGGFPISGQWLRCTNKSIIAQHFAKVYGKAKVGAPPMSVPHLDSRIINGERELLFGPFAGFSTKFLKNGSYFDLPLSLEFDNLLPMLGAGLHNIPLTQYLISQVTQSMDDRMDALREFYPKAEDSDWELVIAGQRVQVIKKDEEDWGKLEFGTEVIISHDKTIAGLLGASPGASTSYTILKSIMETCFG